jgi:hypothetical protein
MVSSKAFIAGKGSKALKGAYLMIAMIVSPLNI